jgi:hypothetical protein
MRPLQERRPIAQPVPLNDVPRESGSPPRDMFRYTMGPRLRGDDSGVVASKQPNPVQYEHACACLAMLALVIVSVGRKVIFSGFLPSK